MTQTTMGSEFLEITDHLVENAMRILRKDEGFSQKEIEKSIRKDIRKKVMDAAKNISTVKVFNFIENKRKEWLKNEKAIVVDNIQLQFFKSPVHSQMNEQYTLEIKEKEKSPTLYDWRFLKSNGTMTSYTLIQVYASTISAKNKFVFETSFHELLKQDENIHIKTDPHMVVYETSAFFKLFKNLVLKENKVLEKAISEDKLLKAADMLLEKDGGLFGYQTIKQSLEIENRSSL